MFINCSLKKIFIYLFVITIFLGKSFYSINFLNPNYYTHFLDTDYYKDLSLNFSLIKFILLIIKDFLLFFFLIYSFFVIKNKIFSYIIIIFFSYFFLIHLLKFLLFDNLDIYSLISFKNIFLPISLIYVSFYINFKEFISLIKILSCLLFLFVIFQYLFFYPDFDQTLSSDEKIEFFTNNWITGFISGRPIGFFDSPNTLGKFSASVLVIFITLLILTKKQNIYSYKFYFMYLSMLFILIILSQTIAVIFGLSILAFFILTFLLINKKIIENFNKILLIFLSLLTAIILTSFFFPEYIIFYFKRIDLLIRFLFDYLPSLNNLFKNFDVTQAQSFNNGFGTYSERFNDLILLKNCLTNNTFSFFFIGCKIRYDSANLGIINFILSYGLISLMMFLFFIIKIINLNFKFKILPVNEIYQIKLVTINISLLFFIISFFSKIIEIGVVNYIFYILIGFNLYKFSILKNNEFSKEKNLK